MTTHDGGVLLCCMLWAHGGRESELEAYETRVLALVPEAGGEVVQRARGDGSQGHPHEVQFIGFPSQHALQVYLHDPRRTALTDERDRAIARTELFPVTLATPGNGCLTHAH